MSSPNSDEVAQDFSPFLKIYKDGRIERLMLNEFSPASLDPKTNVQSKDVILSKEPIISSRLYLPKDTKPNQKLPVLVYYHGGGFVIGSPFCPLYHHFLNTLVGKANVIAVSVDYRLAPENPIPIPHEDSWEALKWVASHANGDGPEEWLNSYADFGKVFLAGDSAGGNITHNTCLRFGQEKLVGINIIGIILVHPYFWGVEPVGNEPGQGTEERAKIDGYWRWANRASSESDDPFVDPVLHPNFAKLGCKRVLVFVAEKDFLRDRGVYYCENLVKCGFSGSVDVVEAKGEVHAFHLRNPPGESASDLLRKFSSFLDGMDQ